MLYVKHGFFGRGEGGTTEMVKTCLKNVVNILVAYIYIYLFIYLFIYIYTGCPRRNVPGFGRMFLTLKYTDITQNTYVQS
jgi:hypothetical protein